MTGQCLHEVAQGDIECWIQKVWCEVVDAEFESTQTLRSELGVAAESESERDTDTDDAAAPVAKVSLLSVVLAVLRAERMLYSGY